VARALCELDGVDIVNVRTPLDWPARYLLYQESGAVLANSGHEPFGPIGLETMAVGGIACTGCSGEDYAVPGHNALVMQTADPQEFLALFEQLHASPYEERAMREAGRDTARQYEWSAVVRRALLPRVRVAQLARPN
jgi:glycosyltransferase involved in cell wall biosynthesis